MPRPSVSRDVHYVSHGTPIREDGSQAFPKTCRAAKVTEVATDEVVSLFVMNPTGTFFQQNIVYDENKAPGTWHWPERVD